MLMMLMVIPRAIFRAFVCAVVGLAGLLTAGAQKAWAAFSTWSFSSGTLTVTGTSGNDFISVFASSGKCWLYAANGGDVVNESIGDAAYVQQISIASGDGDDTIRLDPVDTSDFTGLTATSLLGGKGSDSLIGTDDLGDKFYGGVGDANADGDNWMDGLGGNDTFFGGEQNDTIVCGAGDDGDFFFGGGGGGGNDSIVGGDGDDVFFGEGGKDTFLGGAGDDWFKGGDGNDSVLGGAGLDSFNGEGGEDTIEGGDGADLLLGGATNLDYIYQNQQSDNSADGDVDSLYSDTQTEPFGTDTNLFGSSTDHDWENDMQL
jgi:Ca2+-binding RTX toxin-like protein